jgi:SAM-dependent methyltransferase
VTGSLAYRQNEAAILRGDVPGKYLRILPFIPEGRVFELGSAEGVLALLLAKQGQQVTALEKNRDRHANALRLARKWGVSADFVNGGMQDNLGLLPGHDVFIGVRSIYYLRSDIDAVFAEVAKHIPTVVLCGNKGRAAAYNAGRPHEPLGEFNYYASLDGMKDLLTRHGYRITDEAVEGDPIVVGRA